MADALPSLSDRDHRKALLAALGVDTETSSQFRLMVYQDPVQTVLFKAAASPDGTYTLTESLVLPTDRQLSFDHGSGSLESGFRRLPHPIKLSGQTVPSPLDSKAAPPAHLEMDVKNWRELEKDVTLMALAVRATQQPALAMERSNANLPRIHPTQTSREV